MIKQPLVVGYKGEIGSFILNGLLRIMPKALDIWCIDVKETKDEIRDRILASDVVFLCIPMENIVEWLIEHKEILKGKIIFEQASLKEWIYEDVRIKDLDVRAMHILFKPSQTSNKEDRKIGFIHGQICEIFAREIVDMLQSNEAVWYLSPMDHDKEMAIQQALIHRMLMVAGNMLDQCNGSTYITKRVKELRDRIQSGNKGLYSTIQGNKYLSEQVRQFVRRMECFDINGYWE